MRRRKAFLRRRVGKHFTGNSDLASEEHCFKELHIDFELSISPSPSFLDQITVKSEHHPKIGLEASIMLTRPLVDGASGTIYSAEKIDMINLYKQACIFVEACLHNFA